VHAPPITITNTDSPALYQGERYGAFSYSFQVPNGEYVVTLKFAEAYVTGAGQRQFDVAVNGAKVETNFDIYAAAGGRNTAIDRSYVTQATTGAVEIVFSTGAVQNPKVDAIAITRGASDAGTANAL
jgi:hypothetical protein